MEFNNRLILKVLELVLCIACVIFAEVVGGILTHKYLIVYGTIGGYTVICAILVIGHFMDTGIEKRLNGLISLIGCILFIISGAIVIEEWHDATNILFKDSKRNSLAAGSLMIINGVVFLLDAVCIYKS